MYFSVQYFFENFIKVSRRTLSSVTLFFQIASEPLIFHDREKMVSYFAISYNFKTIITTLNVCFPFLCIFIFHFWFSEGLFRNYVMIKFLYFCAKQKNYTFCFLHLPHHPKFEQCEPHRSEKTFL